MRNERCGRAALDRSIAKPAFEKFAKNRHISSASFGVNAMGGCATTAQLTPQDLAKRSSLGDTARAAKIRTVSADSPAPAANKKFVNGVD